MEKKEIKLKWIPVIKIQARNRHHRFLFDDEEDFKKLVVSIKENGLLQPIVVRKTLAEKYELIAGERRFNALKALEIEEAPCIMVTCDETEARILSLAENIHRVNATAYEVQKEIEDILKENENASVMLQQRV